MVKINSTKGVNELESRRNLIVNGSGRASGGEYNQVKIKGEGTVTGPIECITFKTFGNCELLGDVKAEIFQLFGDASARQNVEAKVLKIFGTFSTDGAVRANRSKVKGTLDIQEHFRGEEVNVKGSIAVQGDVEAESFVLQGGLQVGGLLNAGTVHITLRFGESKADEIGGERIIVKRKIGFFPFLQQNACLSARVIEGDDLYLEHTEAEIVRGRNVHIGPGCEIELVEYSQNLKMSKDTIVKGNKKV